MLKLPGHNRYAYSPIVKRPDYSWPGGKRLAFYVALNIEHFAFNTGIGMGWACPHMRTQHEGDMMCAAGWSPAGIDCR